MPDDLLLLPDRQMGLGICMASRPISSWFLPALLGFKIKIMRFLSALIDKKGSQVKIAGKTSVPVKLN